MSTIATDAKLQNSIDQGFDFFYKKNYEKARDAFKKFMNENGAEVWEKTRISQFISICERALDPKFINETSQNLEASMGAVSALINEKHFSDAITMLEQLDITKSDFYFLRAEIEVEQGNLEEAAEFIKKAIEENPLNRGYALNSPAFRDHINEEPLAFLKPSPR